MQAESNIARKELLYTSCDNDTLFLLNRLLECIANSTIRDLEEKLEVKTICRRLGKKKPAYVYFADRHLINFLKELSKRSINYQDIVSIGVHVAIVEHRTIKPTLGLLNFLALLGIKDNYIVVNDVAEKHFLYGRNVFEDNIVQIRSNTACPHNIFVVVNNEYIPLGWGRLGRAGGKGLRVINLIDLGWYLRSGV